MTAADNVRREEAGVAHKELDLAEIEHSSTSTLQKDRAYWQERTGRFGAASVGYGCDDRLIRWDNARRARALLRLVRITPGMRVLDVGTGAGYWAIRYAKLGAAVTGLDFCEDLLRVAEARARSAGVEIAWLCTPLEQAVLPPDTFDLVTSITCLQHITDEARQRQAIQRILRSLKPHGIFLLVEDTIVGQPREDDYMRTYSQQGWIELLRSQGAEIVGYVGVSFLRFRFIRVLAPLCVALDSILGKIRWFAPRATVTAFAFRRSV